MTKQEFETLMGTNCTDEQFKYAEDIYYCSGSLTKQDLCADLKNHPGLLESKIVSAMAAEVKSVNALAAVKVRAVEKLQAALLDAATLAGDDVIWATAKELIGAAEVIKYKVANELDLSNADCEYIKENLK